MVLTPPRRWVLPRQRFMRASSTTGRAGEEACVGGATRFLSRDRKRAYDVDPRAGTALLFQHDGLLHEGARVEAGVKYAVRMDILYEWVPAEE